MNFIVWYKMKKTFLLQLIHHARVNDLITFSLKVPLQGHGIGQR